MADELILANAKIVTRDAVVPGSVRVVDGNIVAIDNGLTGVPNAIDVEGDYLLPGLVDIHTDTLEKHMEPRPGVHWPTMGALLTHDRQVAAAGITTVFDSLCVGDFNDGTAGRRDALALSLEATMRAQNDGLLRAEHLLHLRCEVTSEAVVPSFADFADHPLVRLVSVMDHTPGQRQWSDLESWRRFTRSYDLSDAEMDAILEKRLQAQEAYSQSSRSEIVRMTKDRGLALASHDDATADHVMEAVEHGITISEFPTTAEAARLARRHDMWVVMGAPNVVMGGSHSGNVSASALAEVGLLDGLASDYVAMSMIHACFLFRETLDMSMPQAVATVTANPAEMVGLTDRGEIAPGKRADLVRVKDYHHMPVIAGVWRQGRSIA